MAKVFISYRRADGEGYAGRIWDRLISHFGPDRVFMDVDSIDPGASFPFVLDKALSETGVLVAVVSCNWLGEQDDDANRLHDPDDFVRREIQTALDGNIIVIPILVGGATMPVAHKMPNELITFANLNALEIRHTKFDSDVAALVQVIEKSLQKFENRVDEMRTPSLETKKFLRQHLGEPTGIGKIIFGPWKQQ